MSLDLEPGEFRCAMCQGVFLRSRSDLEALSETKAIFGQVVRQEDCDLVCDDCFKKLDLDNHPHRVEEASAHMSRRRRRRRKHAR
jgi:hypothetical protein